MNALKVGDKARINVILNPCVRHLRGRVVTVVSVPSVHADYDADVKTRDGWDLSVRWGQLEPHVKGGAK